MKIEKWQAAFLPPAPSRNSIETQSRFCSSLPGIFSTQVRWSDTDKRRERGTQKNLCALRENMPQASWKKFQAESAPKPCSGSVTWSIYVCCLFWGCGWYCIVSICTGSHPVDGTPHDGTHTHRDTEHTLQRTNKQIYLRRPLHSAHRAADQSASARRGVGAGLLSPLLLLLLILILLPLLLLLLLLLLPGAAKATTMGVVAEGCSSVF